MKKLGDESLPENVYSLDSDESETQCFSEVHGARGIYSPFATNLRCCAYI